MEICIISNFYYKLWRQKSKLIIQYFSMEPSQIISQPAQFNMFQMKKKTQKMLVTSINKHLNKVLGGGFHYGMISQVFGQAGSGKTQLAMLFTIGAINRNQIVGFLSIEKQMHGDRFLELAYSCMNEAQYQEKQNLFLYRKTNDYNLAMQFIQEVMGQIKQSQRGGLLVIDSVHGLMTACFEQNNIQHDNLEKSKKQAFFVNRLRWLAKMSHTAVIVINHAADIIDKRRSSFGRNITSALGPSWQLHMDENIQVSKKGEVRQISIFNSPKVQSDTKARFRIESEGFVWIDDDGVEFM